MNLVRPSYFYLFYCSTFAPRGEKLGAAFAGILLMVSLHLLEGSKGDDRGDERCQHIMDIVETYGRMSGPGQDGEEEQDDDDDEHDGEIH